MENILGFIEKGRPLDKTIPDWFHVPYSDVRDTHINEYSQVASSLAPYSSIHGYSEVLD